MPFRDLDTPAIARSLSRVADREGDLADAFFERQEILEQPDSDEPAGLRVWQEEGFALRLIREGAAWMASSDQIDSNSFARALRQITRVAPTASSPLTKFEIRAFEPPEAPAPFQRFPSQVTRAIRRRLAAFPVRMKLRLYRRWVRVVGIDLAPNQEHETFYSFEAEMPWGRHGALLSRIDEGTADQVATSLTMLFRARQASPVRSGPRAVVLGPGACAVLLHEAVAHALETDTLAMGGRIEAAIGVPVGSELLNVLDNPEGGPEPVSRRTDDEGTQVCRRWLLRGGVVEQLLADRLTAHDSPDLMAGAGRRGHRHVPPVPRSSHLELLAGDASLDDLLADSEDGLFLPEASRGNLDPISGEFTLWVPYGRTIHAGKAAELTAPCLLKGRVSEILGAVSAIGSDSQSAGAGWCAKGGIKMPVWATAPALRLEKVEVRS